MSEITMKISHIEAEILIFKMKNQSKIYRPNRKVLIHFALIGMTLLPVFIFILNPETFTEKPLILLPLLSPLILLFWAYFDTSYKIIDEQFYYRSAFVRGKIDIATIKAITKGKTKWTAIKPALARNGLIIKFSRWDDIYIPPENNDEVIADLLSINPNIKISAKI